MTPVTPSSAEGGNQRVATKLDKIVALVLAVAFVIIGGWSLSKTLSTSSARQALVKALNRYAVGLGPDGHRILTDYLKGNISVNEPVAGRSLLDVATQAHYPDIVAELLRRGSNPNLRIHGVTPLYSAAVENDSYIAEMLIDHGADVNEPSLPGWPPLSAAISTSGDPELIRLLVAHGANVNFIDPDGTSPLDLALERKDSSGKIITGIIEAAGGKTHLYQPRR